MVKTYTANGVGKNHDWDFSVDEGGNITKLVIKSDVNYRTRGFTEELDIWPILNSTQKNKIQQAYNLVGQWFDNQFLGGN